MTAGRVDLGVPWSCSTLACGRPYTFAKLAPVLNASAETQPVVLREEGLYNLNAVESMATAMEISAMGARNVARLITQKRVADRAA